ncbi:MAG TPA: hypothetical protein VFZ52_20305 [Chryseolinea sp.]
MMRNLSLAAILILLSIQVNAKKIQGKIILNDDREMNVTMIVPFGFLASDPAYIKLQNGVKYLDASNKKITIRPDDAKEISFKWNGRDVRMLSVNDDLELGSLFSSHDRVFLKLEIDGAVKLFTCFWTQSSPGMYNATTGGVTGGTTYSVEKYALKMRNGPLTRPRGLAFRKDMTEFFADCPELVERIQSRDFKKGDLELMVRVYNEKCAID